MVMKYDSFMIYIFVPVRVGIDWSKRMLRESMADLMSDIQAGRRATMLEKVQKWCELPKCNQHCSYAELAFLHFMFYVGLLIHSKALGFNHERCLNVHLVRL